MKDQKVSVSSLIAVLFFIVFVLGLVSLGGVMKQNTRKRTVNMHRAAGKQAYAKKQFDNFDKNAVQLVWANTVSFIND